MLFIVPIKSNFIKDIDIDIIKAPHSIEISMVRQIPSVTVRTEKIEEVLPEKLPEEKAKIVEKTQEKQKEATMHTKPLIGAITEQISSLMINKPPPYPSLARIKGWEGEVVLIASVNKKGSISKTNILSSSGYYILDSAAVKAISKWHFRNIKKSNIWC